MGLATRAQKRLSCPTVIRVTALSTRPPKPPSSFVRAIARAGVPLGVLFGLLALGAAAALIYNLVEGGGLYRTLLAAGQAAFLGGIACAVGVEVPKNVQAWDVALAERKKLNTRGR